MNYIFLAGIGNSEPDHWQSIWFRALGGRWVDHADWDRPRADDWVADLERTDPRSRRPQGVRSATASVACSRSSGPSATTTPISKARSWSRCPTSAGPTSPKRRWGSRRPTPAGRPPLPALVVASTNDPYASFASARSAAKAWGAALANVGDRGHINLASNVGAWDEGRALFDRFLAGLGGP